MFISITEEEIKIHIWGRVFSIKKPKSPLQISNNHCPRSFTTKSSPSTAYNTNSKQHVLDCVTAIIQLVQEPELALCLPGITIFIWPTYRLELLKRIKIINLLYVLHGSNLNSLKPLRTTM